MKNSILLLLILLTAAIVFSGCTDDDETIGKPGQCPSSLQECGAGCIPQNAICCDDGVTNSYCLQPTTGCNEGTCNDCPEGEAFCGMFCIPEGQQCCIGGECSGGINNPTEPNITLVSEPKIVCTFQKTEVLWSPDMPWDGSYVCRGTVTFDFHGLAFSSDKTLKLYVESSSNDMLSGDLFDEYYAQANTPINEVTFTYAAVAGDYFQKNKPNCPAQDLQGLRLVESVPDVENPFPKQEFSITIPATCE